MRIAKAAAYLITLVSVAGLLVEHDTETMKCLACAFGIMAAATYILRGCRDE